MLSKYFLTQILMHYLKVNYVNKLEAFVLDPLILWFDQDLKTNICVNISSTVVLRLKWKEWLAQWPLTQNWSQVIPTVWGCVINNPRYSMFLSLVPFQQCLRTNISPLYYKLTNGRTEDTIFGNKSAPRIIDKNVFVVCSFWSVILHQEHSFSYKLCFLKLASLWAIPL